LQDNGKTKILVLGLGNPILSDDAVGWRVATELQNGYINKNITIHKADLGSLNVLELLIGFDSAILIDAIQTQSGNAGTIYRFTLDDIDSRRDTTYAHGLSLASAIEIGKQLGFPLPRQIIIFAIEAIEVNTFGENLSPDVEKAVSTCTQMIVGEIEQLDTDSSRCL
jgi:hydrogenase maturation protease